MSPPQAHHRLAQRSVAAQRYALGIVEYYEQRQINIIVEHFVRQLLLIAIPQQPQVCCCVGLQAR